MKRIFFLSVFIFCFCIGFSQTEKLINKQPEKLISKENYVIGLPKISDIQLKFIKDRFSDVSAIVSAEFVFGDNILLIETNPSDKTHVVSYLEIEKMLREYFNENDIYEKDHSFYKQLKNEHQNHDKYLIK